MAFRFLAICDISLHQRKRKMLVDNILLCSVHSPTKWKSLYCVYFKKYPQTALTSRTDALFGDDLIHKALGSQRNISDFLWRSPLFGWKSV